MPLQNNAHKGLDFLAKNKKLVVILICILLALLLLTVVGQQKKNNRNSDEYYDSGSGETVYSPKGRTPEIVGEADNTPVFLGFSKLLDVVGLSKFQLDSTKEAFSLYSKTNNKNLKEISIFVDSIKVVRRSRDNPDPKQSATFDVKLDRKETIKAKLEYFDIRNVQLFLYDEQNKLLFDSGVVDVYGSPS